MPNVNVQFFGQTLVIPNAYYSDNVQATLPSNPALTPPLIFIGNGYGQKPMTPTTFVNAQDLLNALRGGPCASFVQFLTNPSNVLNGANLITYINPAQNTQATLALNNTLHGPVVTLTSANYGQPSNLLQAQVVAGALTNSINLTLFDGYTGQSAVGTNLGVPFQLAYTGSAVSGVTYNPQTAGSSPTFVLSSPNPGESYTIQIGSGGYSTITALVEFINGTGHYSATWYSDPNLPSSALDQIDNPGTLPVPVAGVLSYVSVTAVTGDILYWVNHFGAAFASAALTNGTPANAFRPIIPMPFTNFTGATNVPPTTGNYNTALQLSMSQPGWVTFVDSNDPAVIALGVSTAVLSSTPGQNAWRRFVSGSSLGDPLTTAAAQARAMNAYEATYCYPGIYRNDAITGQNTLFSGLYVAAAVAGLMAGNIVAQPMTNQSLVGTGVEVPLTLSQINTLQQAGVLPIWSQTNTHVPTIISDLTTWQADSNPENVFNQQVACRFGLAYSLQQGLAPYVGTIASKYGLSMMKNAAISILNQLIFSPGNNGILVSWDTKSLSLAYAGSTQTVNLTVNVVFVGQVRFILELAFVQPLSLAA